MFGGVGGDGCVETIAGRLDDRCLPSCTAPQVWRAPPGTAAGRDTSKQFGLRQTLPPDVCRVSSSGVEPLLAGAEEAQVPPTSGPVHPPGTKTCTRSPFSLINNQSKTFHPCIVWLQRNDWNLECTLRCASIHYANNPMLCLAPASI